MVTKEEQFFLDCIIELNRGREKFPGNDLKLVALTEEIGEFAKALLDEPSSNVRAEAVQVAALACRIIVDGESTIEPYRQRKGLDSINENCNRLLLSQEKI